MYVAASFDPSRFSRMLWEVPEHQSRAPVTAVGYAQAGKGKSRLGVQCQLGVEETSEGGVGARTGRGR
jgi:hypothetical protein